MATGREILALLASIMIFLSVFVTIRVSASNQTIDREKLLFRWLSLISFELIAIGLLMIAVVTK